MVDTPTARVPITQIVRIQRFFRQWFQSKHPLHFVSNFYDRDILSLEPIRDLDPSKVFFLCSKHNNKLQACDSEAWLGYFVNHYCFHPVTKQRIDNDCVWECFLKCRRFLPESHKDMQKCNSSKLCGQEAISANGKKFIKITPQSPLVRILLGGMTNTGVITPNGPEKKLTYKLCDSRDSTVIFTSQWLSVTFITNLDIQITY